MKRIISLLAFLTGLLPLSAQTKFTALKIAPGYPTQRGKLSFEFNKSASSLAKQAALDIVVYQFTSTGLKATEPVFGKKGSIYNGSILIDSNTNCIVFGISSGNQKDINDGNGYIVPVYTEKNIPVESYYKSAYDIRNGLGEYLFGITADAKNGLAALEEGIQQYPALKNNPAFLDSYLYAISRAKKNEAPSLILSELQNIESKGSLTEEDYSTLVQWYGREKKQEKVDSLTAAMKAAFPEGGWKKNEAIVSFNKEEDLVKKLAMYKDYVAKYPPAKDGDAMTDYLKTKIANAYAGAKDYKKYNEWSKGISKSAVANNNNNIAWGMAEEGQDLEEAKKMSYVATAYAKKEMLNPTEKKPDDVTKKLWDEQRKTNYAMFGDTYAFILYKLGDYKTGFPFAKDAATIHKLKNAEYNERYALLAEKVLPPTEAKKLLEQFTKEGTATSKTKEALKNLYIKEKKSDKGFEKYLAVLEASAKIKKRAEIAKSILNDPSPKFSLTDFEGKAVSLDDLKGKVVVVDFWATWCGPCVASMPGMNKTLEQYKDNENVKFLFVDTWESADNKLQNAKDFMTKKNYPFYVLMDNDNKMVEDFKVSGIPTKFVIDKQGNICFKAVGFGGNDDELVEELTTMIDIAGK